MNRKELDKIKQSILVFDIECSSSYPHNGEKINIKTHFDDYVKFAKVKWFGCYSYKYDMMICDEVVGNEDKIRKLMGEHDVLCGFNSDEFDLPIMYNNNLVPEDKYYKNKLDLLCILGSAIFKRHDGLPFKNRAALMGKKPKNNSLKAMAEVFELDVKKGDIDYNIFFQKTYTDTERQDILEYLNADVLMTKQLFEKVWDFWLPFTEFLYEDDVLKLSWIKSSIASLTYQAACKTTGVDVTYSDNRDETQKEEMGGRVILPKYEEARDVWYVDFTSLYPHIFCQFNLFGEVAVDDMDIIPPNLWHGNELFQVRGYYDISEQHPLSKDVAEKLKRRRDVKRKIKETGVYDSIEYSLKIFLNSLYGAARSSIFEQIYKPNCGWDCCWLGQQINYLAEKMMKEFGFETIAGDTDSIFVIAHDEKHNNEEYVKECLKAVVDRIKDNVPFPAETYGIDIEADLEYVMWPFGLEPVKLEDGTNKKVGNRLVKEWRGKKKNYVYLERGSQKLGMKGLPIKKDNATGLGMKIFKDYLEPMMIKERHAKFDKAVIDAVLESYLTIQDNLHLLAREFKVQPAVSYKLPGQLQAQISTGYFNGQAGVIKLIKNKKIGNAGKTSKYCTVEEAINAQLSVEDIDIAKVENELAPFVRRKQ